jgi:hypothetical protein
MEPRNKPEIILCAAIWFNDGKSYVHQPRNIATGVVMCGHRHGCIFEQTTMLVRERRELLGMIIEEQGFLTSKNRFVDRTEGAIIAKRNNQCAQDVTTLYSENLY